MATQMFYDDLPIWSFIGQFEKGRSNGKDHTFYYVFLHMHFIILYNGNRVVDVMRSASEHTSISEKGEFSLNYTFSVEWTAADTPFEKRLAKFMRFSYLPQNMMVRSDFACPMARSTALSPLHLGVIVQRQKGMDNSYSPAYGGRDMHLVPGLETCNYCYHDCQYWGFWVTV